VRSVVSGSRCSWRRSAKQVGSGGRLVADVMQRISITKPDLFARNLEEGAPLGSRPAGHDPDARALDATGKAPGHSPAGREEIGNV
jgi:hypothetical protein